MNNMQLPVPPSSNDPQELYVYIKSLHNLLKNLLLTGTQISMIDSDQLAEITANIGDLAQAGKNFYNITDNEYYRTKISAGSLIVESF